MVVYTRIHLVIVSIHTPTQGVTTSIMYPAQASQFQSTHPRRVWLRRTAESSDRSQVSIHTPTQGVTYHIFKGYPGIKFQSTHPRRVWQWAKNTYSIHSCFNPHTHAGCDKAINYLRITETVSIHTPTQGVTSSGIAFLLTNPVSIHTPTQGVTLPNRHIFLSTKFQSTHPRRVWHRCRSINVLNSGFNPHTHAGCDSTSVPIRSSHTGFNPHTHAGCDSSASTSIASVSMFQSTHPRRVWLYI